MHKLRHEEPFLNSMYLVLDVPQYDAQGGREDANSHHKFLARLMW